MNVKQSKLETEPFHLKSWLLIATGKNIWLKTTNYLIVVFLLHSSMGLTVVVQNLIGFIKWNAQFSKRQLKTAKN